MKKKLLSLTIALSLVLTSAGATGVLSKLFLFDTPEPMKTMVDSGLELRNEIHKIIKREFDDNPDPMMDLDYLSAIEVTDSIFEVLYEHNEFVGANYGLSQAASEEIETYIKNACYDRYIVKSEPDFDLESMLFDIGINSCEREELNYLENCSVLYLDEPILPFVLAYDLTTQNYEDEIIYIQPDWKLNLATENEFSPVSEIPDTSFENVTSDDNSESSDLPELEEPFNDTNVHDESSASNTSPENDSLLPEPEANESLKEPDISDELLSPPSFLESDSSSTLISPIVPEIDTNLDVDNTIIIALIDSGIDIDHPSLNDHLWNNNSGNNGWNFCDGDNELYDADQEILSAHGTYIASIIAEQIDNAKILPLKAFDRDGGFTSDIIEAIAFAEESGAAIVNCSFSSQNENPALEEAMTISNMLFIVSAGNHGQSLNEVPAYPACFDAENIFTVASVDEYGELSPFTNYSEDLVDIAALGQDVIGAFPEDKYIKMSGTSASTALVTGTLANLLEAEADSADLTPVEMLDDFRNLSSFESVISKSGILNTNEIREVASEVEIENHPVSLISTLSAGETGEKYVQIEMTRTAVIALREDGTVWTWGYNDSGICGISKETYTDLSCISELRNITKIAAGDYFCLALRVDGTVWGWGRSTSGQLGSTADEDKNYEPVQIFGLSNIIDIAAGSSHVLALRSNGRVYAWGENADGQLGDGSTDNSDTPLRIVGDIEKIAAGSNHSLAIDEDGCVWAWGDNSDGQFGDSTTSSSTEPVESEMIDAEDIAAGSNFSLAIEDNGTLYAWGENSCGQLGIGSYTDQESPVECDIDIDVEKVVAYGESVLALDEDGYVWAWGDSAYGQLGLNHTDEEDSPAEINDLSDCIDIAISQYNGAALENDGTVWIWGRNTYSVFGNEEPTHYEEPVEIPSLSGFTQIVAGSSNSMGVTEDNLVYGWGINREGILGDGTENDAIIPVLADISPVESVSLGYNHALAQKTNGRVYAWGNNVYGQLGDETDDDSLEPVRADGLTGIEHVEAGYRYSLAIDDESDVYSWGYNKYGQLSTGDTEDQLAPFYVESIYNIDQVAAGKRHMLALRSNGRVYVSGDNKYGQLGDGTNDDAYEAFRLDSPRYIVQVDAGDYFSVALDEDGYIWTWGENSVGQLGNGTFTDCEEAEEVPDLEDVIKVAAGDEFCLALLSDGTVWGWGCNEDYQLGTDKDTEYDEPREIDDLENIVDIIAGSERPRKILCNRQSMTV